MAGPFFKNVPFGGSGGCRGRIEAYNVLNILQFKNVDPRNPRIMPASLRALFEDVVAMTPKRD